MFKIKNLLVLIVLSSLLIGCSGKEKAEENNILGKKKRREINIDKKTDAAVEEGGLFGTMTNKETTFKFGTSNVLWRASLSTLDFVPLNNVDYSGGIIVSDWYAPDNSRESVKIIVRFLSNELKPSSVQVKSFKKICSKTNECVTKKTKQSFNTKIKEQILIAAKEISIEDEEKKLKK